MCGGCCLSPGWAANKLPSSRSRTTMSSSGIFRKLAPGCSPQFGPLFDAFCKLAPGCSRHDAVPVGLSRSPLSFLLSSSVFFVFLRLVSSSDPLPFSSILKSTLSSLSACLLLIGLMDSANGAEGAPLTIVRLPAGQKARP